MSDLRDELRDCADELRRCAEEFCADLEARTELRRTAEDGVERLVRVPAPDSPHLWRGSDGHPVLAKILAARAQCLVALAALGPDPRPGRDLCGQENPASPGQFCSRPPGHEPFHHRDDDGGRWGVLGG